MKFLCLHGSYGSAVNFKAQLSPFTDAVEKTSSGKFKWIDGGHRADPPPGFEAYFGNGPYHRFIDFDGVKTLDSIMERIRDFPEGSSAEDTIRELTKDEFYNGSAVQNTLDRLFDILDADPEIEGILGYSEGATTAATLILEERRRFEEEGIPRRIKCAVFFAGWPPLRLANGNVQCVLADECDDVIDVPTCHIVGCNDPYIHGAMALYSMCDEDSAALFDHGKGHTVPRDPTTVKELAAAIEESMRRAQCV